MFLKLLFSQRSYVYTWYSICGIMHIRIHFPFLWGQSKATALIHWLISVNHYKENDRKIETVTITNSFLVKGSNVVNAIVVKIANIVTTWTKRRKMHQFQLAPLKRRYVWKGINRGEPKIGVFRITTNTAECIIKFWQILLYLASNSKLKGQPIVAWITIIVSKMGLLLSPSLRDEWNTTLSCLKKKKKIDYWFVKLLNTRKLIEIWDIDNQHHRAYNFCRFFLELEIFWRLRN